MAPSLTNAAESIFDIDGTSPAVLTQESSSPGRTPQLCLVAPAPCESEPTGDTAERIERAIPPRRAFRVGAAAKPSGLFIASGKWEGVVESIDSDGGTFEARLTDILGTEEELVMTFDVADVSPEDEGLLLHGAVFYWNVGYYDRTSGQRTRVSELKFRRLPVRRERDLARARERAKATLLELGL